MSEVLGEVVRLQVQRSRLKPGERAAKVYDPAPLQEVAALRVGPRGAVGLVDGREVLDVHHADHPDTRNVGLVNGLSLMTTTAYAALRSRYGEHLVDGAAGESLLLEVPRPLTAEDLAGPLSITTDEGVLELVDGMAAPPCVEFSRWCLGVAPPDTGEAVRQALLDLDGGARGWYVTAAGAGTVRRGARLVRG